MERLDQDRQLMHRVIAVATAWIQGRQQRLSQFVGHHALRLGLVLALVTLLLGSGLASFAEAGAGAAPVAFAQGIAASQGKPNLFNPKTSPALKSVSPQPAFGRGKTANAKAGPPQSLRRNNVTTMRPALIPLTSATQATTFLSNDKRLEVDVPAGAVSASDLAAASGSGGLHLQVTQVAPASGSNAGGSGLVSFGTYLLQLVNGQGVLVSHGLRQPVTLTLHYAADDNRGSSALDLRHSVVLFNGSLPSGTTLAPITAPTAAATPATVNGHPVPQTTSQATPKSTAVSAPPATRASSHFGPASTKSASLDTKSQTLTVQALISTPSTSMSWNTDSPVSAFGKPDPYNVQLSAGALTAGYPITLPSGPGGLAPPLQVSYSSEDVAEQHSPQGAAGWAGEGWNVTLGSITWAEHNVTSSCISTCGSTWEDSWQLNDPYGTAAELIPPNINTSTYWDDSPFNITPSPVQWQTAPETYAKVYSFTSNLTLPDGGGVNPPCFRVWLTNGIMEEFGCTADSLEYYYTPGMGDYIASWNLDLITDPQGNQIHITYQQDQENLNVDGTNHPYIQDAQLSSISWDSPSCQNAQTVCTTGGTAPNKWAPLMQVTFNASHTPTRLTGTPSGCNTGTNLRCDDPLDLSAGGNLPAPQAQSDFALNDIDVQVNNGGTWHTLNDYQFEYTQTGPSTITDPATGLQESVAGEFVLSQIKDVGADGSTALPASTFSYSQQTEYYEDDIYQPNPATNCGPAWNTGSGSGCLLWGQSYAGNSYYLATVDNGMGLHQIFSWEDGRNNTHGVNGGGSNTANPNYCNTLSSGQQATYPCNEADDENWSHVVLTQQNSEVVNASSTGNTTVQNLTSYAYDLTYPLAEQECSDCVAGMYWGNQNDGDYLDYYNAKFMGFAETDVSNADGSVEKHHFYSTEGYGIYDTSQVGCFAYNPPCGNDPWWQIGNAGHGHEYEVDSYATNGVTLLKQVTTQYQLACPPSGVAATPPWTGTPNYGNWDSNLVSELDHNNPVAVCDVQTTSANEYDYNGATGTVPEKTISYTYDSYGRVTKTTENSNGGGVYLGSPAVIVTQTDYVWNDNVTATATSATGTYLIDFPADSIVEDSGDTTHYSCSFTGYDGHAPTTGTQSWLTLGETTTSEKYTSCGNSSNSFATSGPIESTYTFDSFGNQLTSDDPDANAGNSADLGCTVNSVKYSTCASFDATFEVLPSSSANALNQVSLMGYSGSPSATNGYGLLPISSTDPNNQTTDYGYDALGRMTSETLPGETTGDTTTSWTYTDFCPTTGASTPCVEIDQTQRLNSTTTVTSRAFFDGYGNLVETRSPGPASSGDDVVRYRVYDALERDAFDSISYFVPSYTGGPGSAAFSSAECQRARYDKYL